ncbi:porin [Phyllobacterium sp. 628]|uniref:porin n=1 Tax=Phyllobacterium sp. 628 TaxID=2718938 RepID=UPI0016623C11|nr:porin [Phyllobacterium sp. 628]QND52452.1 porin [Phyllobacterium sp. 628]
MNIKSLLLGSAAALVAVTGARAADAVVVAEPEAVEYVRVCDAYGAGFFYIPGTETCLKISGYVRNDLKGGDDAEKGIARGKWADTSRATLRFDARSDTELGTLKSYAETRFDYTDGASAVKIVAGYIQLGGFQVGLSDSQFNAWVGYAGDIISDDVVSDGPYENNQISYTFTGGNGFSAVVAVEQGSGDYLIDNYVPHVVAGVKIEQAWGGIAVVGAYDSVIDDFAGKVRLDLKASDALSFFVMGGYKAHGDVPGYYGSWNGDWAVWGGGAFKASDKATINAQVAYEDGGKYAAALNVGYELVPGFQIKPEINYTHFTDDYDGVEKKDAYQGILRFQRNF